MVKVWLPVVDAEVLDIVSERIWPRRRVSTAYTRPRTSVEAWISQEYMASSMRGDQSSMPLWMPERTALMTSPVRRWWSVSAVDSSRVTS